MLNTKSHTKKSRKIFALLMALVLLVGVLAVPAYATGAAQLAENGAKVILEIVFWVVIVSTVVGVATCVAKKNTFGMVVVIVLGVIVSVLCKRPDLFTTLGNMLTQDLGL